MAELKVYTTDLTDGKFVFDYSGGTQQLTLMMNDVYDDSYYLDVNVYDTDGNNVLEWNSRTSYEDYNQGDGYRIYILSFDCGENNNSNTPMEGYISIGLNSDGEYTEIEVPYYVKYYGEGEVHPFVSTIKFNADGTPQNSGYNVVSVGYNNVITVRDPKIIGGSDWLLIKSISDITTTNSGYDKVFKYQLEVLPNTLTTERTADVRFIITDNTHSLVYKNISVIQYGASEEPEPELPESGSDEVVIAPIWQDTLYSFSDGEEYGLYVEKTYRIGNQIRTEDVLIYSGKVYTRPDEYWVDVAINRICQNYIDDADFPFDTNTVGQSEIYKFKLKVWDYLKCTYYFVRDWSYKQLTIGFKTNPILPYIGTGQRLFTSFFSDETNRKLYFGMEYYDGTDDYSNYLDVKTDVSTEIVAQSRLKGVDRFWFRNEDSTVYKSFKRLPLCKCKYVLYYMNPYGGWDWFTVVGRVTKKDKIDQYTYTKNYNNTKTQFGKYRYLSEIHTTYTLHSGWLTQAQSDRMWELLESNCVYLHNLEEDKIIPVVLTHTDIEHKQKTNRSRMIDYEIIAEESQTKERI